MSIQCFDVLIVGAGLSGIGAACHLQKKCPNKTYAILEGREAIGGTWDLFRYPGIRSDSDMYTLGYSFKPWTNDKSIADGTSIRNYIREAAKENDVEKHIRFGHRIIRSSWSTPDATWTVEAQLASGEIVKFQCNFLLMCSGYYNYAEGFTPQFDGVERFKGRIIHPQKWPTDLDYTNKRVVVIGSGATAVTLVPAMTDKAAHVTMLQRSPTYVATLPEKDPIALKMRKYMPDKLNYRLTRTRNVAINMAFYALCQERPKLMRRILLRSVRHQVGNNFDMKHFSPRYNPWDERLCAVPNGDLFKVIRKGKASVVTDHIECFTEKGIKLKSGAELEADIIVTATGLKLQAMGGMELVIDNEKKDISQTVGYKAMMFSDVPNLAMVFGYTNASWTLKADLTSEYVCRLLNHMDKKGLRQCTPRINDPTMEKRPWLDFAAGYVQRSIDEFPRQGSKTPWKVKQNYMLDLAMLRYGSIVDEAMKFTNPVGAAR